MPMSEYVRRLREAVGSDLLLLPAATSLVKDDQGRMLLVRQAGSCRWAFPGGGVEPGETPEEAAVREVREECSIDIELDGIMTVVGGERFRVTYPNGHLVEYFTVMFAAHITRGMPEADRVEISDTRWFGRGELGSLELEPFARNMLEDLGWLSAGAS
ncbi:MAG: NUDIX domain-containing protein [Acidimicrobiales bacterium]